MPEAESTAPTSLIARSSCDEAIQPSSWPLDCFARVRNDVEGHGNTFNIVTSGQVRLHPHLVVPLRILAERRFCLLSARDPQNTPAGCHACQRDGMVSRQQDAAQK